MSRRVLDYLTCHRRLDELYEDKKLNTHIENARQRAKEQESKNGKYILESRFQLLSESLNKSKIGSKEFEALLNECVNIYLELNEGVDTSKKNEILKLVKDKIVDSEIIGEFDEKKQKQVECSWPGTGRKTLKDVISKSAIGQNSKTEYPKRVTDIFGSNSKEQPSPSNSKEPD